MVGTANLNCTADHVPNNVSHLYVRMTEHSSSLAACMNCYSKIRGVAYTFTSLYSHTVFTQ